MGLTGRWEFWIDRGGTFTGVVARRGDGTLATSSSRRTRSGTTTLRSPGSGGARAPWRRTDPVEDIAAVKMGTTVATNALLERKGEPTVLVTTSRLRGCAAHCLPEPAGDLRPGIELPDPAHTRGHRGNRAARRRGPGGDRWSPGAPAWLQEAFDRGFRSVAVVLMHAFRNSAHELRVGELAHDIGFTQISLSHEVIR